MSQQEAAEYYHGREQKQRLLADRANDPAIRAIHRDLAKRYAALWREAAEKR